VWQAALRKAQPGGSRNSQRHGINATPTRSDGGREHGVQLIVKRLHKHIRVQLLSGVERAALLAAAKDMASMPHLHATQHYGCSVGTTWLA
jgi:hypothetical protein